MDTFYFQSNTVLFFTQIQYFNAGTYSLYSFDPWQVHAELVQIHMTGCVLASCSATTIPPNQYVISTSAYDWS